MPPLRKPYSPGGEAAGVPGTPNVPQPMQAGRLNAQPPMPMGGNPGQQNAGAGAPVGMIGPDGRPAAPPVSPNAGGPTAPGNIETMLHARSAPMPLAPWGDQGTQGPLQGILQGAGMQGAGMRGQEPQGQQGVNRVPYEPQMPNAGGGAEMGPDVIVRLLKILGRV